MVRIAVRYNGKVLVPAGPLELPEDVPLEAIVQDRKRSSEGDGVLALAGLGAEIWQGDDAVDYQRSEREGW